MENQPNTSSKKSFFNNPLLRSRVHSANVKIFPEALLGYLAGPALALFSNAIINGYLNRYYTDVLGLTSWAKTFSILLPLISVIAVIAGNLLVGRLMGKMQTLAGKARPLLLIAFPLIIAAFFLIFFAPYPDNVTNPDNATLILILVAIGYNLYYSVAYPFYYVAHSALVNLSTRNSGHRGLLATASNASGLAAVGLVNMVFPLFQAFLFNDGDRLGSYNAWRVFIIALVIATALGILLEYMFTRERITEESFGMGNRGEAKESASTSQQVKVCLKDKYWWFILIFFLLYQLGGSLKNNSGSYYTLWLFADPSTNTYTNAYGGQINSLINTVGMVPTAIGMVLVWPLANKFGKAKTILFGGVLAVIGGILGIFWGGGNVPVAVAAYAIKALGGAPAMYISLALLSDVLDHQEAVHGFRTDGFTMSIYGSIMIGANGIANGVINGLLSATGYDATKINGQSAATQTALGWTFYGGETIAFLAIAILFIFMNVEKFSKVDHAEIIKHQKEECEAKGIAYVEPAVRMAAEQAKFDQEADEARKVELRAQCEKKHLDFASEEALYEAKQADKEKASAAKKAAAEAKKEAKVKAAADAAAAKEQARKDALKAHCDKDGLNFEEEERRYETAIAEKAAAKAAAQKARDDAIQSEFDAIRAKATQKTA